MSHNVFLDLSFDNISQIFPKFLSFSANRKLQQFAPLGEQQTRHGQKAVNKRGKIIRAFDNAYLKAKS